MFEIIGVKGNSVRVKCGLFLVDVEVLERNGRKVIRLPENVYAHNFKALVGIVLAAHNKSNGEIISNESKKTATIY